MVREGYKETEIGEIPEDWELVKLSTITTTIRNGTTAQQSPSVTKFFVTRIETISDWKIDYNSVGYLSSKQEFKKFQLIKFDSPLANSPFREPL